MLSVGWYHGCKQSRPFGDWGFIFLEVYELDYGKTLNLPETEFPMRAGLPEREPGVLEYWQDSKIYEKKQALHAG